jgi:hypothetical protein
MDKKTQKPRAKIPNTNSKQAAQMKKLPAAPPVYRPQPVPKVLQTKSATGQTESPSQPRSPVAPPVYRPQQKKIAQPKMKSVARAKAAGAVRRGGHGNQLRAASIQLAHRTGFSNETQKALPITVQGDHRRHIIPSSLFVDAINNWNAVHNRWSTAQAQAQYEELNNHQPNLIRGSGIANMAAGGIMHKGHQIEQSLSAGSSASASPATLATDISNKFQKVAAFGGTGMARDLVGQVTPVLSTLSTQQEIREFVADIGHSGSFDWPTPLPAGGPALEQYQTWQSVYNGFVYMRDSPSSMDFSDVQILFSRFLSLHAPALHH